MYHPSRSRRAGFTLLELTVSLGVAAIMLFLIDRIFFETQRAITAGIKTGEIMVKAETIGSQIQLDAEIMKPGAVGGSDRGPLIIVQKLFTNVQVADQFYLDPTGTGKLNTENIRSDQISFIVKSAPGKLPSMTPENENILSSTRRSQYARVWYGHVQLTQHDGTSNGALLLGDTSTPENLYANRWALGRQALLFDSTFTGIHTTAYAPGSTVNGLTGPTRYLFEGVTDICKLDLDSGNPGDVWPTIDADPSAYPNVGLNFAFVRATATDGRLQANRAPGRDPNLTPRVLDFTAAKMAQLHPLLAVNVSDFIVEFAGDYDGTLGVDLIPNPGLSGTDANGVAYNIPEGALKWYGFWYNNPTDGRRDPAAPYAAVVPASFDATQPVIFKISPSTPTPNDFVQAASAANESYYLGDAAPAAPNADAVFIFRHDDSTAGTNKWPYLLRIRYRLHDDNGVIASSTNYVDSGGNLQIRRITGKWYEHIIRVPRP